MAHPFDRPKIVSGFTLIVGAFVVATGVILGAAKFPVLQWWTTGSPTAQSDVFPGFTVVPAPPPDMGLIVTSLQSNSPAALNGIVVGDRVEALDSNPVKSLAEASNYLRHDSNAFVRIRLLHNDGIRNVTLRIKGDTGYGA